MHKRLRRLLPELLRHVRIDELCLDFDGYRHHIYARTPFCVVCGATGRRLRWLPCYPGVSS